MKPTNEPEGGMRDRLQQLDDLRSPKRMKRRFRKLENATVKHAHTFVIGRWRNVLTVRRHAFTWLVLVAALISLAGAQFLLTQKQYQSLVPVGGGTFAEGVLGKLDTLNPVFAVSNAERAASKLMFAGLLTYDQSSSLKGDLAESWDRKEDGKRYIVTLRPDLRWHDGAPLTSEDVVFTINSIKNADVRSPLYASWRDVLVKPIDERRVQFDLPAPYAPFPHALTVGIIPKHKLGTVAPTELRADPFNRAPIGSGPFVFRNLQVINAPKGRLILNMAANSAYHQGTLKVERFQLHTYNERDDLKKAIVTNEVNAVADLSIEDIRQIKSEKRFVTVDAPINDGVYAIMRTDIGILQDAAVRRALRLATDRSELMKNLDGRVKPLEGPFTSTLMPSVADLKQPAFNIEEAGKMLDSAGWVRDATGKRSKDGQPLQLNVVTVRSGDYPAVLEKLVGQWAKLGIQIETQIVPSDDVQQNVLIPRAYDILIYELAIGGDPDVYAYWHSSQAQARGLNLANYRSGKADDALDTARVRAENELRDVKYRAFTAQWLEDVPAVALYQPSLHYVTNQNTHAIDKTPLVEPTGRYRNVKYWTVDQATRNETP